jgi:multimeric flavodoxin WrbA
LKSVTIDTLADRHRSVRGMRVRVAYYSRKGITEGLSGMVAEAIRSRGHDVTMVPIRHVKRPGFLGAGRASMKEMEVELANDDGDYDLGDADMIILGGPVFAGKVNPYTRTFVKRARGLEGKVGGVLITCASGPIDGVALVDQLAQLASAKGLEVRGRLVGSRKVRDRYPQLAEAFVAEVLDLDRAETAGDGE